jgi:CHAD domain-containing protein
MATTAGDLLLSYLEQQLSELRRHVPGVREEQAESVHQMRVAARRLRSLLASSRKLFSSAESEDLRDELRWLSGALGAARDARVVQARLRELLEAEPQDLTDGQPARRIDENLDDAATAGHQDVLAALDSDRYARLITGLDSLLSAGSLSQRAARPPRKVFKKAIAKDTARMVRAVDGLSAASDGDGDGPSRDAGLHEVRKAAKRLRYCAELASTIRGGRGRAGKRARKTAKAARRIQTTLGLHHDTVMSRTLLAELGLRSQPAGQSGFSFGRLHAREESLAADAEADFARMWRKFPGRS